MTFDAKHFTRLLHAFAEATIDAEFGPAPEHREAIRHYLRQTLIPGWHESLEHVPDVLDSDDFDTMLTDYADCRWRHFWSRAVVIEGRIMAFAKKELSNVG